MSRKGPMGDSDDSSSGAAQRAQRAGTEARARPGFFRRIAEALTPDGADGSGAAHAARTAPLGLANLSAMRVEDVAIPKADIVAVPMDISRQELVEVFRESGLTRIPVYEGTLDTPVGFVHLKDFALRHGFNGETAFSMEEMVRPLHFVPPSMPIGVLLAKMQADRTHMALVIDEYGGTDGLVTIEDVIEPVIGEIEDEHDIAEGKNWQVEGPGVWMAKAKTPLEEFESEIGMALTEHEEIDEEEIDTLGGLVSMLAGHVPARGEVIPHPEGPEFEVVEADPRRIKRLRVRLNPRVS